jgi:multisubunit Na+/H+ antiporter MnhB subunit
VSGGRKSPPDTVVGDVRPFLLDEGARDGPLWLRLALAVAGVAGAAALGAALLQAPARQPTLPLLVAENLGASGVSSPVTAVLLNFRVYDTLLEVAVLVAAMVAVWSMDRGGEEFARREVRRDDPVLGALVRLVVPLVALVAVYLTWAGADRPGGAFQGGALLAGAGVLLAAAGYLRPPTAAWWPVRAVAAAGLYGFVGVAIGVAPWTGYLFAYPGELAYPLILAIEALVAASIAVILVELFVDVPAVTDPDPDLAGLDPTGDPLGRLLDPQGVLSPPEADTQTREIP